MSRKAKKNQSKVDYTQDAIPGPVQTWLPICRFNAYDFNEATGRFLDSSSLMELQQEETTKLIRTVRV